MREGFAHEDPPWLETVARSVQKDGLAVLERPSRMHGTVDAVAEERPAYGAESSEEVISLAGLRIGLP